MLQRKITLIDDYERITANKGPLASRMRYLVRSAKRRQFSSFIDINSDTIMWTFSFIPLITLNIIYWPLRGIRLAKKLNIHVHCTVWGVYGDTFCDNFDPFLSVSSTSSCCIDGLWTVLSEVDNDVDDDGVCGVNFDLVGVGKFWCADDDWVDLIIYIYLS